MTFSPNLYTLQPQGQPLNLTKYLEAELKAKKGEKKNLLHRGIELTTIGVWGRCLTYYSTETFTSECEALTLHKLGVAAGERRVLY